MWWGWLLLFLGALLVAGVIVVLQRRVHAQRRLRDALQDEPGAPPEGPPRPAAG
jgi:hypothetical protein